MCHRRNSSAGSTVSISITTRVTSPDVARNHRKRPVLVGDVTTAGKMCWGCCGRIFAAVTMKSAGLGLAELARGTLLLYWRWALRSRRGEWAIRSVPTWLLRLEGTWSLAGTAPRWWPSRERTNH